MSDSERHPSADDDRFREPDTARCPNCDSVVKRGDGRCLMCGQPISQDIFVEAAAKAAKEALRRERERMRQRWQQEQQPAAEEETVAEKEAAEVEEQSVEASPAAESPTKAEDLSPAAQKREKLDPDVVRSGHRSPADFGQKPAVPLAERIQPPPAPTPAPVTPQLSQPPKAQSWRPTPFFALTILGVIALSLCGIFGLRMVDQPTAVLPLESTATELAVVVNTPTSTPSLTPTTGSSATPTVTDTPTITPTPRPTDTPRPPRFHTVESGETIISIALLYGITVDSIANTNGINPDSIQGGQDLQIPWPTATPPLQPLLVEVGEDSIVVDPSVCPPFYEIQDGDNIFSIAAQNDVPFDAMLLLNRLTIDSVVRPGDVICIPAVIENGVLPPTPGPSPTPSNTPAPAGAQLLYPPPGTVIEEPDSVVALQWLAVKDLAPEEYYMIEVIDLDDPDAYPHRGFTRSNSFQIPAAWRAPVNEVHEFRWRVSIVQVTDTRADGTPIYTYGGRTSTAGTFFWLGAVPTPTPPPTFTPTATPSPTIPPTETS